MWFDALFKGGLLLFAAACILTGAFLWLGWLFLLAVYFFIQRMVPFRMEPDVAREMFGTAVLLQLCLVGGAAALSGSVGATLLACGVAANFAVISLNGFRMPILDGWSDNPCYLKADDATRAVWLSDLFATTPCRWANWTVSAGDALEVIGFWVLAAELVLA